MMKERASAAEISYHAARVGFIEDLLPSEQVALGTATSLDEVVAALAAAPKPVRVTGHRSGRMLRLTMSDVTADPEIAKRFKIRMHNSAGGGLPVLAPDASADAMLVVIAFDQLLRVSKAEWLRFTEEYWIDGPLSWSADRADSQWAEQFKIPASALRDARAVVLFGYQVGTQVRSPVASSVWEAA